MVPKAGVSRFLSERELEQVIEEIYDNEGSEVDWSDSDAEQEEASVPINMSSDSSDSDAELQTRADQSSGYPRVVFVAVLEVVLCEDRE